MSTIINNKKIHTEKELQNKLVLSNSIQLIKRTKEEFESIQLVSRKEKEDVYDFENILEFNFLTNEEYFNLEKLLNEIKTIDDFYNFCVEAFSTQDLFLESNFPISSNVAETSAYVNTNLSNLFQNLRQSLLGKIKETNFIKNNIAKLEPISVDSEIDDFI